MTYIRLDDRFPNHRKAIAAGPIGRDLYVNGLCYCSLHLTDGLIPRTSLGSLSAPPRNYAGRGSGAWSAVLMRTADLLVEAGLWEVVEGVGWCVHDYHEWNKTASEIADLKNTKAEAGRRGGRRSWEARRKHGASPTNTSEEAETKHAASLLPNPSAAASVPPHTSPQAGSSNGHTATPPEAFRTDCPDQRWHGRCVDPAWVRANPGARYPASDQHGTPKRCPSHRA